MERRLYNLLKYIRLLVGQALPDYNQIETNEVDHVLIEVDANIDRSNHYDAIIHVLPIKITRSDNRTIQKVITTFILRYEPQNIQNIQYYTENDMNTWGKIYIENQAVWNQDEHGVITPSNDTVSAVRVVAAIGNIVLSEQDQFIRLFRNSRLAFVYGNNS